MASGRPLYLETLPELSARLRDVRFRHERLRSFVQRLDKARLGPAEIGVRHRSPGDSFAGSRESDYSRWALGLLRRQERTAQ